MTVLLFLLGVVIFLVGIAASIGLHEMGHLVPAKRFGVKVTQYFIGFGNTVWSTRRGETEYGVKSVPLGGYVKLVGMLPPEKGDPSGAPRQATTGMFSQLISDTRAAEAEHIGPGDEDRLFYKLPVWKKVVVMSGGPLVNIAIAFFLFAGVFGIYGTLEPTTTVQEVSRCVVPQGEGDRSCTEDDPVAPAAEAGLLPGDRIVAFNGEPVATWDELVGLVRDNRDGQAVIRYERDGETRTATTNTTVNSVRSLEGEEAYVDAGFLGVVSTRVREHHGLIYTGQQMGDMTVSVVEALATLPVRVWGVAKATVGLEERAQDSPISIVGAGRISGEVASDTTSPWVDRLVFLVMLLASLNLFIGMFNLVPLLPLDGGHIAGALYEGARRTWARIRHRPDPGFVDVAKLLPVAYVVAGALLVMSLVLIAGDLVAPVQIS
jgi:membrane-associated protease RseP (regulator of RpoE activity)